MKKLILLTTLFSMIGIKAFAEETVVGASPDPYQAIWATADEEDMKALKAVVYYESAKAFENDDLSQTEVNIAVIETILNRCLSDAFKSKISDVCKQRGQFTYLNVKIENKAVSEAIEYVRNNGRTVLPDYDYYYFATKKQSLGKDHVWIGNVKTDGRPRKGKGMYFCRGKL